MLGASWQQGSSSLWFQSAPTPFGGRSQFSGSHKYWSLRYGSHAPGWGWSLSHKGRGLWLSPQGSLGAMWSGKGSFAKQPWTAQATVHSKSWVGRGSWGPLTLQRSLPGSNIASLRWDSRQIDALWGPGLKAVGFRLEGMDFGANKRPASLPTWRNLSGMAFERGQKPSAAAILPADRHQGPPNWSLCGRSGFWDELCRTAECSPSPRGQLGGRLVWWAGFGPVESGRSVGL